MISASLNTRFPQGSLLPDSVCQAPVGALTAFLLHPQTSTPQNEFGHKAVGLASKNVLMNTPNDVLINYYYGAGRLQHPHPVLCKVLGGRGWGEVTFRTPRKDSLALLSTCNLQCLSPCLAITMPTVRSVALSCYWYSPI